LVRATGHQLDLQLRRSSAAHPALTGPLGERVQAHREEIHRLANEHGVSNLRLFGSVARGDDTSTSDIDLLVDLPPHLGLLGLARLQRDLSALLDAPVEVVPAQDLKAGVRERVQAEAVAL